MPQLLTVTTRWDGFTVRLDVGSGRTLPGEFQLVGRPAGAGPVVLVGTELPRSGSLRSFRIRPAGLERRSWRLELRVREHGRTLATAPVSTELTATPTTAIAEWPHRRPLVRLLSTGDDRLLLTVATPSARSLPARVRAWRYRRAGTVRHQPPR
jgi:hypothetical protein